VPAKQPGIRDVTIHRPGGTAPVPDRVAVEEPLEVRVNGALFAVIMRTPGADRELAAGFLLAEDVIRSGRSSRGLRCGWAIAGRTLLAGQHPLDDRLLLVSGRTSFELVQKALLAGVPLIAAVSAPSSLAIDLATKVGITLCGFVRADTFNIYSHPQRIGHRLIPAAD